MIINPLPTSKIFGEKVDAWWYQEHGFDVEFWDLSPIYFTGEQLDDYYGGAEDYRYTGPHHQLFLSKKEVLGMFSVFEEDVVIWHLGWGLNRTSRDELWLFDAIVASGIPFFVKQFESDPKGSFVAMLKQWWRAKIARLSSRGGQPEGFIGSGSVACGRVHQVFPGAKFISIPSPMVCWSRRKRKPAILVPYIVFVDEGFDYIPDCNLDGTSLVSDLQGYYCRINAVFDGLEDLTNMPVIIAASGKVSYNVDRFAGRLLMYGETLGLIQNCELVIGHGSGALVQAIVSKKTILQLLDESFTKTMDDIVSYRCEFTGLFPIQSDDLDAIRAYVKNPVFDAEKAAEVESMYFREPDVHGDYREIIKQAFLSI